MPKYRFEFADGGRQQIPDVELPNDQAARNEAMNSAKDLVKEAALKDEPHTGSAVRVFSESGQQVADVHFEHIDREELAKDL